jgi:hypothetical protein
MLLNTSQELTHLNEVEQAEDFADTAPRDEDCCTQQQVHYGHLANLWLVLPHLGFLAL